MLADEEDLRAKMKLNINEYEVELRQLLQDLGLPARAVSINCAAFIHFKISASIRCCFESSNLT